VKALLGDDCYDRVAAGKPFTRECGSGRAGFAPEPIDGIKMLWEFEAPDLLTAPRTYDVYSYHRRLPEGDLYLLFNRKPETRKFEIMLATKGVPEQWNPVTGEIPALAVPHIKPEAR